jgi:hypothetical protein
MPEIRVEDEQESNNQMEGYLDKRPIKTLVDTGLERKDDTWHLSCHKWAHEPVVG